MAGDRFGREKRWRATAIQDAGAFAGMLGWCGASWNAPTLGALRGRMMAEGSEKGKVELRRWARAKAVSRLRLATAVQDAFEFAMPRRLARRSGQTGACGGPILFNGAFC